MINKQSLWFITLFSLIIVLGIYYFSTDETSLTPGSYKTSSSYVANMNDKNNSDINVLKITDDEVTTSKIEELQDILLDNEATLEEKNNAYDELEVISTLKTKEEEISRMIKNKFSLTNYVKINNNQVSVVVSSNIHNNESANKIIREVQNFFDENKYITVKFNE